MKKKVQYNIVFIISRSTSAITHAVCGCPAGKGPLATCKHIGAFCLTLEEFCRLGKLRDLVTCTDQPMQLVNILPILVKNTISKLVGESFEILMI